MRETSGFAILDFGFAIERKAMDEQLRIKHHGVFAMTTGHL
jgi:hypothetical protein